MRDSIVTGMGMILKLVELMKQLGINRDYNFVNVVITDGEDTNSKASLDMVAKLMLLVGKTIPKE